MGNQNSSLVDKWRTPAKLKLLTAWARDDYSLGDIADKIGITIQCLRKWRDKYPEIDEAISTGKEETDYRVENALLKVALGYTSTETKTIIGPPDKNGNRAIKVEKTEKKIPPNPTAIMCWLNNRKSDQWKRNRDNIYQTKDEDSKITVNIIRHGKDDFKDEDEKWDVSAAKTTNSKVSSKKAPADEDLDYWPDDWEEDE